MRMTDTHTRSQPFGLVCDPTRTGGHPTDPRPCEMEHAAKRTPMRMPEPTVRKREVAAISRWGAGSDCQTCKRSRSEGWIRQRHPQGSRLTKRICLRRSSRFRFHQTPQQLRDGNKRPGVLASRHLSAQHPSKERKPLSDQLARRTVRLGRRCPETAFPSAPESKIRPQRPRTAAVYADAQRGFQRRRDLGKQSPPRAAGRQTRGGGMLLRPLTRTCPRSCRRSSGPTRGGSR